MAFTPIPTRTPVSIGNIIITLTDRAEIEQPSGTAAGQGATFQVRVLMSDGSIETRQGNLAPHITIAQRNGLLGFLDDIRAQAITQLL